MRCSDRVGALEMLGRELLWLEQVDKSGEDVTFILSSVTSVIYLAEYASLTLLFDTSSGFSSVRT